MRHYKIEYKLYDPGNKEPYRLYSASTTFDADSKVHAVNQLLDMHSDTVERVTCIDRVYEVGNTKPQMDCD